VLLTTEIYGAYHKLIHHFDDDGQQQIPGAANPDNAFTADAIVIPYSRVIDQ
jgi:hypothetical protein